MNEKEKFVPKTHESRATRFKLSIPRVCIVVTLLFRNNNINNDDEIIILVINKCRYLCQVSDRDPRRSSLTAIIEFRL